MKDLRGGRAPTREPRVTLLTLGSNIEPETHLFAALDALDAELGVEAVSSIYEAEPVGAPGTPRFLNAAVRVTTIHLPVTLKRDVLRPLESRLGRVRTPDRNAPRTIDVDIAAVDGLVLDDRGRGLRIPDPDMLEQPHLAVPLGDVAPDFLHPVTGARLADIAARFGDAPGIRIRSDLRWPRPPSGA
ncbi:MAG: 2-amino-4-hydroxy-6-hydroxymethyldihydropteridine diphosphokinase [Gemmatimonadetes bacterium]|nr:2-amino-4-hydroxy-6-hydroxymethyldihydropteridine diphosphokinase [Gemmatimonadota bacterium]